jgi:hypothetical protein
MLERGFVAEAVGLIEEALRKTYRLRKKENFCRMSLKVMLLD